MFTMAKVDITRDFYEELQSTLIQMIQRFIDEVIKPR